MPSKRKRAVPVVGIALVIALALTFALVRRGSFGRHAPLSEQARIEQVREDSLHALAAGKAPLEIGAALVRLADLHDPRGKSEALARIGSADPHVRELAGRALGYYDDSDAWEAAIKLLADPVPQVRVSTLLGLGLVRTPARAAALERLRSSPEAKRLAPSENVVLLGSLARATADPEAHSRAVSRLLAIAAEGDTGVAAEAARLAMREEPKRPEVLAMIKKKLPASRNPAFFVAAVRHLAREREPWLGRNWSAFAKQADAMPALARVALIESVALACPEHGKEWLLLEASQEKDRWAKDSAQKTLDRLAVHPGGPASICVAPPSER